MDKPKKIYLLQKTTTITKTLLIEHSDGSYTESQSPVDTDVTYDGVVKEWFEDENGIEVIMEVEVK